MIDWTDYAALILAMTGEMPARKVADKILRDHPDLESRATLAAFFAGTVKCAWQGLDEDPDDIERHKMDDLLDVIFYMLGGTDADEDTR